MSTLYVVGMPAAHSWDLTLRARRIVAEARLALAEAPDQARQLLADAGIDVPVVALPDASALAQALAAGDVALLLDGRQPGPSETSRHLVQRALEAGHAAVPVPGPALPFTALVVSGLPADSVIYLGELPPVAAGRRELLEIVSVEPRTLVVLVGEGGLADSLANLYAALGDRPLALMSAGGDPVAGVWRGRLALALEDVESLCGEACVLVVGGATQASAAWGEARLAAEIERRAGEGQGAKEISQALAPVSGWSRREIYRRAAARTGTREDW